MIFFDAQLPPSLAPWLGEGFGVESCSMRCLGLQACEDTVLIERARAAGDVVLVSKDSDCIEPNSAARQTAALALGEMWQSDQSPTA